VGPGWAGHGTSLLGALAGEPAEPGGGGQLQGRPTLQFGREPRGPRSGAAPRFSATLESMPASDMDPGLPDSPGDTCPGGAQPPGCSERGCPGCFPGPGVMVEAARLVRLCPDACGTSLWHAKGTMRLLPRRVCRPGAVAGSLKHLAARRAVRARVSRRAEGPLSGAALQAQVEYCDSDSDTVTKEAIDPWAQQPESVPLAGTV
jgi:hypothetical protein